MRHHFFTVLLATKTALKASMVEVVNVRGNSFRATGGAVDISIALAKKMVRISLETCANPVPSLK